MTKRYEPSEKKKIYKRIKVLLDQGLGPLNVHKKLVKEGYTAPDGSEIKKGTVSTAIYRNVHTMDSDPSTKEPEDQGEVPLPEVIVDLPQFIIDVLWDECIEASKKIGVIQAYYEN